MATLEHFRRKLNFRFNKYILLFGVRSLLRARKYGKFNSP